MSRVPRRGATGALVAVVLGLTLGLSACGDDGGTANSRAQVSRTEHDDADVAFATDMIQHHAQALSMVDLTVDRPLDPEVRELAEAIRVAQAPEIEAMSDWLVEWGEKVPATMRDHVHAGHDQDDMAENMEGLDSQMPGMMTAEDLSELERAADPEFQDMWLEMMIEHHEGAVEMAQTEQSDGRYKPAVDLAGDIAASQSEQIETMNGLLASA